jgi:hypothetical protein
MKIFNLKTIFALASLFCFTNTVDAKQVEVYAKILPNFKANSLLNEMQETINRESKIELHKYFGYHMTIKNFTYEPDTQINSNLFNNDTNKTKSKTDAINAIKAIYQVPFKVNNVSSYGSNETWIVLELKPDYTDIDVNVKKACQNFLEKNPHLSLAKFSRKKTSDEDLSSLHRKILSFLKGQKFYFNKIQVNYENDKFTHHIKK